MLKVGVEVKKGKDLAFMKTILAEENALVIDKVGFILKMPEEVFLIKIF